ncbi:hypothetical protein J3L16_08640 [Alteromonas sp. 5E99-2]|uniref:hypothetical protein n=1 Tax=Alteromonas sp. 5E99-2 TaxID=2817683 RepID=UPI001A9A182C|nr:hypothetical protein [Alteromonas sp. 5E99-2]MBO1255749.1 hypothetical protein [Alteromonas sp. 5E99-2]
MKEQMDLGLPDKIDIHHFADHIHISRKWFGASTLFLIVFAAFWDIFLFSFYSNMSTESDIFTKLFPLIHVAVGIGITYFAIASCFNKSNIFVSKQTLEINHKPFPWVGNKTLKSYELKQLYTKEKISTSNNSTRVTYEVHAIMNKGKNTKLLSGLESSEQALYIEQEIEKYLQIQDIRVKGEIS